MAKPKLVLDGHAGEGPAWDPRTQSLFFTGGNRITRSEGGVKHPETFRMDAGGANGLLWDKEGRLAICEGGNRRVTRMERDGTMTVLAEHYEGMKFNSPNDLAIDSKGRLYFTDPRYGPRDSMEMRGADGKLVEGVYRIDAPGKVERIIASEVDRPNGILVSADDRWLFVADNNNSEGGARKLWRFDLDEPGRIVPDSRKLLFDWKTSRGPDGLKMDTENRLYVAGGLNRANPPHETTDPYRGGIYILSMEGEWVDFVPIPNDEVTNCAFGGPDLKTLFITAGGTLWSVPVNTRGRISGSW